MNGHYLLENKLKKNGIEYTMIDNAFHEISNFKKAQELSDKIRVEDLHQVLDSIAKRYCPLPEEYQLSYNRKYKGFNFFSAEDQQVFEFIARGEFNIKGMQN